MAVAALAVAAGLLLVIAYGTTRLAPARSVDSVTVPAPPAMPSSASSPPPGRDVAAPREADHRHRRHAGQKKRARPRKQDAPPRRHHRPVRRPHRPAVRRPPKAARPAPPQWITNECKRRYPYDPARSAACVGMLTGVFGR